MGKIMSFHRSSILLTVISYTFPGDSHPQPKYRVDMITHRKDAILPVSNCGRLSDETVSILIPNIV